LIAIVNGAGTTSEPHSYSFVDKIVIRNITYYRLGQTGMNGKHLPLGTLAVDPNDSK